jgi:hypothetical protein
MRSPRGIALGALAALTLIGSWPAALVAQPPLLYESARRSLDLSPDPVARSPRLLGMGRLVTPEDIHNRFNLWDLAQNPTGLMEADTVSTFEVRPSTAAASAKRDVTPGQSFEREYLAAREILLGYEVWRRNTESGTVYGLHGDLGTLRVDRPFSDDVEERGQFQVPRLTGVFSGRMPYLLSDRLRYGLRIHYAREERNDEYRFMVRNSAGEYVGQTGDVAPPPDFFTPLNHKVSSLGGGLAFAYRFGTLLTASIGYDGVSSSLRSDNTAARHFTGLGEDRFYNIGDIALVGRAGALEYGADARGWKAESEERYVFTLSAGIGQPPFGARGKRFDREEKGSTLNARARWTSGPLQLGAGLLTGYRKVVIHADNQADSWNSMIVRAASRTDTLELPDFIESNVSEERSWNGIVGGTWRLPWREALVGAEFHAIQVRLDQVLTGAGPYRKAWDIRTGLEVPFTSVLKGRIGYIYRTDDRDDLTTANEYLSHTGTIGLGLAPSGALWTVDAGYALEFLQPDFGDPTEARESRQQLAAQMRWAF